MGIVVAIDAGTTGVRSFAIDTEGRPGAVAYREFTQHFPRPGWVEHDATEIWQAVVATLGELVQLTQEPVAAVGITDQRETVVVWDRRTSAPKHRAIVWQDRRTAGRCEQLHAQGHLDLIRQRTGLVLDPYFSGTKLEWLLSEGGVEVDADTAFGTIDSWLLWNLTGGAVHATDPSNASRTMLYDIGALQWSDELCDLLSVPASVLPEVAPSCGRFGETTAGLPIPAGIPISGIAGDQQASLFGQACFEPGMAKNTYGTGSFVLMNVGTMCPEPIEGLLTTVAWTIDGRTDYALEGAIFSTGATVQWLRDGLGIIDEAAEVGPLAASVADAGGVVIVPAFTGLGSPWWDPYARGTVVGLTRGSGRAELARAAVESMAFQTPGRGRRHGRRLRRAAGRTQRRRGRRRHGPAAPDPGRPTRRTRDPRRCGRDHGAGGGVPGRDRRGGVGRHRHGEAQLGRRGHLRAGHRPVERRLRLRPLARGGQPISRLGPLLRGRAGCHAPRSGSASRRPRMA